MVREADGGLILDVQVVPKSRKNNMVRTSDGLKAHLTAPPVDGKANAALVEALSDVFGIPKRSVTILRGDTSRKKTVKLDGVKMEAYLGLPEKE